MPGSLAGGGEGGAAGLYGKLPAFGDFVTRRLPIQFVMPWDEWLQEVIAASRERLGKDWLDVYLVAPLWRFLVSPGVCGGASWAGVLMPSVDRVGRHFPVTLAVGLGGQANPLDTFLAAQDWFTRLEALALEVLSPHLDFEPFDARLAAMPLPPVALSGDPDDDTVPFPSPRNRFVAVELDDPLAGEERGDLCQAAAAGMTKQVCLWATGSASEWGPVFLASEGLPRGERFCAMLDGQWEVHGWTLKRSGASVG